jgi:hypothetical protein
MCLWLNYKKKTGITFFFILKVTEERRIRTKKSRIPNTGCLWISGRGQVYGGQQAGMPPMMAKPMQQQQQQQRSKNYPFPTNRQHNPGKPVTR